MPNSVWKSAVKFIGKVDCDKAFEENKSVMAAAEVLCFPEGRRNLVQVSAEDSISSNPCFVFDIPGATKMIYLLQQAVIAMIIADSGGEDG